MFRKVIVGVDEHQGTSDAIALAKQLAAEDAELTLANVYVFHQDPRVWRGCTSGYAATDREQARKLLEAANEQAGGHAQERWTARHRSAAACTSWPNRWAPTCWSWAPRGAGCSGGCSSKMPPGLRSMARRARSRLRRPAMRSVRPRSGASASATTDLLRVTTR